MLKPLSYHLKIFTSVVQGRGGGWLAFTRLVKVRALNHGRREVRVGFRDLGVMPIQPLLHCDDIYCTSIGLSPLLAALTFSRVKRLILAKGLDSKI